MDINKILDSAEGIQKEMNVMIDTLSKTERGKKLKYEDLQTVFFFMKIAELTERVNSLEKNKIHVN